jgi:MFS family permease
MITPFLVIYLIGTEHLSITVSGVLATTMLFIQRGGTFASGIVSDRYTPKAMLVSGCIISSTGYLALAETHGIVPATASAVMLGIGPALFSPACKAILAQAADRSGPRVFALRTTVTNIGSAIGPLLGAAFFAHFTDLLLGACLIHAAGALGLARAKIPAVENSGQRDSLISRGRSVLTDSLAIQLMAASIGFWFCYSQFTITIPLYALAALHTKRAIGLLTAINAVTIIIFQFSLISVALKTAEHAVRVLSFGMIVMAAAFLTITFGGNWAAFIAFTLLFSLAELLIAPSLDAAAHAIAPAGQAAAYLGFVSAGGALGAILGSIGIVSYRIIVWPLGHPASWPICILIAVVAALAFAQLRKSYQARRSNLATSGGSS